MKRSLSFATHADTLLVVVGTCLIAGTYGLVRLAYGLFLPDIRSDLAMSNAVAGYVASGASVVYCVGALVGMVAADRPRMLVTGALTTASVGAAAMALAPNLGVLVPAAVLASAGAGLASPGMVGLVARNLAGDRRARGQAVVNSGTGPGLVAAGLMALLLLPHWRAGFAVSAVLTATAGLGVLLLDRPERGVPVPQGRATSVSWLRALLRPAVGAVLLGASSATVWTYGRALLVDAGASDSASVVAWMAIGVGGAATVLTARRTTALSARRAWVLTTAATGAATAALAATPGAVGSALACAAFGWAFVAATSALIAWAAQLVPERAAAGTSALFVALTGGQAAGATVAGALADPLGLPATFVLAGTVAVAAAVVALRRPSAPGPRSDVSVRAGATVPSSC